MLVNNHYIIEWRLAASARNSRLAHRAKTTAATPLAITCRARDINPDGKADIMRLSSNRESNLRECAWDDEEIIRARFGHENGMLIEAGSFENRRFVYRKYEENRDIIFGACYPSLSPATR